MLQVDRRGRISVRQRAAGKVDFPAVLDTYRTRRQQDRETLERMVSYARSGQCRWQLLLSDLDQAAELKRCGACDNCRRIAAHENEMAQPIVMIGDEAWPVTRTPPAFTADDRVRVRRFGPDVVIASDATSITVGFEDGTQRCFHPDYVPPLHRAWLSGGHL